MQTWTLFGEWILRIVFAGTFLWNVVVLTKNWKEAVAMMALVFPRATALLTGFGLVCNVLASLGILFHLFPHLSGLYLAIVSAFGLRIHPAYAKAAKSFNDAPAELRKIAVDGQNACTQKNLLFIAVGLFFALAG